MVNILVLDDDYDLASSWRSALEEKDHSVDLCFSSSEAIAYVRSATYDFFIVDLFIPSVAGHYDSGRLLLQELKATMTHHDIGKFVIGTSGIRVGTGNASAQLLFSSYGVSHFLAKPFSVETLVDRVEDLLK